MERMARVVAAAALVLVAGCADDQPSYQRGPLRIATGGRGGVYFAYGQGISQAVNDRLNGVEATVVSTAASVDNLTMVGDGRAEMAFTLADSAALASEGRPPFTSPQDVRALWRPASSRSLCTRVPSPTSPE